MTTAYIGIGSNVGDRHDFCRRAIEGMFGLPETNVIGVSSLYETSPVGGPPQRSYINAVVCLETEIDPRSLLVACQETEQRLGRDASEIRWGPRVIDLDILLYGDEKISEPDLEIPHPRLTERRFVLVPLLEIEPELTDPWGVSYRDFLEEADGDVEFSARF